VGEEVLVQVFVVVLPVVAVTVAVILIVFVWHVRFLLFRKVAVYLVM
jgi:hypothetical protein